MLTLVGTLSLFAVACESEPTFGECPDPKPLNTITADTGLIQCSNGLTHRPEAITCADRRDGGAKTLPAGCDCLMDSECNDAPLGVCGPLGSSGSGCGCSYGCVADADCGQGEICLCSDPVGQCVPAKCTTDADCDGALCVVRTRDGYPVRWHAAECETDNQCGSADAIGCASEQNCTSNDATDLKECTGPDE
jgi:hypothetical protein